jgi:hypothetical protein
MSTGKPTDFVSYFEPKIGRWLDANTYDMRNVGRIGEGFIAAPSNLLHARIQQANEAEGIRIDNYQPEGYGASINWNGMKADSSALNALARIEANGNGDWDIDADIDGSLRFSVVFNSTLSELFRIETYNASVATAWFPLDNQYVYFGADKDASILFDGSNLVFDNNTGNIRFSNILELPGAGYKILLGPSLETEIYSNDSQLVINDTAASGWVAIQSAGYANLTLGSFVALGNQYSNQDLNLGHNAWSDTNADFLRVRNTNANFGYRNIQMNFIDGIHFYAYAGSVSGNDIIDDTYKVLTIDNTSGHMHLNLDGQRLYFGADNDAFLSHSGDHFYLENYTGRTIIGDDVVEISGDTSSILRFRDGNAGSNLKYVDLVNDGGNLSIKTLNDDLTAKSTNVIIDNDGDVKLANDSQKLYWGADLDSFIEHDGSDFRITNYTGNIIFDGTVTMTSGIVESGILSSGSIHLTDGDRLYVGTDDDGSLYHDGANLYLTNSVGDIYIGDTTHLLANSRALYFGAGDEVNLQWDGSNFLITSSAEIVMNTSLRTVGQVRVSGDQAGDVIDMYGGVGGAGGYIRVADTGNLIVQADIQLSSGIHLTNNQRVYFGTGDEAYVEHDGSNFVVDNTVGSTIISGDVSLGSGIHLLNNQRAYFGSSNDGYIEYDGTDFNINASSGTGDIVVTPPSGKTLVLGEPVWNDLRVPFISTKLGGTKDPDFAVLATNGSGSQGVFTYWFDDTTEEELYFVAQLSHTYKEETDLQPHVHWVPATGGGSGEVVSWGLEYTWVNRGDVVGDTTIIYGSGRTPNDEALVANKQYITGLGTIEGSGKTISSMIVGRVFRDAPGNGLTDDFSADAGGWELDFHHQIDTLGSRTTVSK